MNSIIYFDDNTDENAIYNKLKKSYPKIKMAKTDINIDEMLEDEYLYAIAEERIKSNRPVISRLKMREKYNITQKDIDETEADFD